MTKRLLKFNTIFQKEPMESLEELFEATNESWSILYFKDVRQRIV